MRTTLIASLLSAVGFQSFATDIVSPSCGYERSGEAAYNIVVFGSFVEFDYYSDVFETDGRDDREQALLDCSTGLAVLVAASETPRVKEAAFDRMWRVQRDGSGYPSMTEVEEELKVSKINFRKDQFAVDFCACDEIVEDGRS